MLAEKQPDADRREQEREERPRMREAHLLEERGGHLDRLQGRRCLSATSRAMASSSGVGTGGPGFACSARRRRTSRRTKNAATSSAAPPASHAQRKLRTSTGTGGLGPWWACSAFAACS